MATRLAAAAVVSASAYAVATYVAERARAAAAASDPAFASLLADAAAALAAEPGAAGVRPVLGATSFEDTVALVVARKLADASVRAPRLRRRLREVLEDHRVGTACRADAEAVVERDPACHGVLEAVLYFKGFAALVAYRVANRAWLRGERSFALWLQSRASAAFGVDIHPAATIGPAVVMDHATGVVIGETAHVGEGCTMLHGVTLGTDAVRALHRRAGSRLTDDPRRGRDAAAATRVST